MSAAPAASLSAGLLVSKGNAQPSRGLAQPISERIGFAARASEPRDLRDRQPIEPIAPVAPVTWPMPPAFEFAPPSAGTAPNRITLRVDDQQRLRLRLASAHLGKSRQVILIEALEHYFKRVLPAFLHDPCPCIQGSCIQDGSAIGSDCCQRSDS